MPIVEGTAECGVSLALPRKKVAFRRDVLAPIAGIDSKNVQIWNEFERLHNHFKEHAWGAITRRNLDGEITRDVAIEEWARYQRRTREEADRTIRFVEELN